MQKSIKRRVLGTLAVVLASQGLTACVVVPVPRHRPVVVQPGYSVPPPPYHRGHDHRRGPDWRR